MGSELGMEFGAPEQLVWIWLVPLAVFVLWFAEKRRRMRLKMVGALGSGRPVSVSGFRTFMKMTMLCLGLTSLVLALAKPRWGFEWIDAKQRGADIMIAVDVSKSMLAADVSPSRLERARRKVSDLLDRMSGDRVGLVAFAGTSFVQCPLTMDYGAIRLFLSYLDPDLIPTQGTDLGAAIDMSLAGLFDGAPEGATTGRAIIIMTDGEDQEGRGQRAAAAAKEKGVKIYTLGIGTDDGTLIPEPGGGFLKDKSGNLVVSKPNESALRAVAEASGGSYVRSVAGDADIKFIYDRGILNDVNREELQEVRTKKWHERFQWFLAAAFFFLFAEPLVRDVRSLGLRMGDKGSALLLALMFALPSGRGEAASESDAHKHYKKKEYEQAAKEFSDVEKENPDDPEVTYNRAVSQFRSGDYKGAAEGFGRSAGAKDPALQEKSWYNLGNSLAYQQKFEDAVKSYENALQINPENQKARENLELVKKMMEQQQQQQQPSDQNEQKEEKEQNEQKENKEQSEQQQDQKQGKQQGDEQQSQTGENQEQQQPGEQEQDQKQGEQQKQGQDQQEELKQEEQQAEAGKRDEQQNNHNQESQAMKQAEQQQYSKEQALQLLRSVQDQIKKYRYMDQSGQGQKQDPEKNW